MLMVLLCAQVSFPLADSYRVTVNPLFKQFIDKPAAVMAVTTPQTANILNQGNEVSLIPPGESFQPISAVQHHCLSSATVKARLVIPMRLSCLAVHDACQSQLDAILEACVEPSELSRFVLLLYYRHAVVAGCVDGQAAFIWHKCHHHCHQHHQQEQHRPIPPQ